MSESPVLEVGTEVSAKYRGAFCEATIKHVKKRIKIRISWTKPLTGSVTVTQDGIKGTLKVGGLVESKKDGTWQSATILKITDASTYTVVFDDGDERTLGRNSVCPQGAKHFNEEMTLDHLPLTNPENFGTPVMLEKKKQRKRRKIDGPDRSTHYSEEDVGKVAFYDTRSKKQTLVPVLIASHSQCDEFISTNPGEVIVRSFKSGKFMSIPKEDMLRFDRGTEPLQLLLNGTSDIAVMKPALEKALAFYDTGVLPMSWETETDSAVRGTAPPGLTDTKLKKSFHTSLHAYWEKRGSPITRQPSVGYHDLDLYQLHCYVKEYGGQEAITHNMKWRSICAQMNILNLPPSGSHTVKNAYSRYVIPFLEDWDNSRKSSSSVEDTPVSSKSRKGRHTPTPGSSTRGRGTPTPGAAGKGRRNSIKLEPGDGESVGSNDTTDYDNMPEIHKYSIGVRVKVVYGAPKHCGSYEAKINDRNVDSRSDKPIYYIHYTGWNIRYDEWVTEESILSLVTRTSKKKGLLIEMPKELIKGIPNRRKIIPKYKRYKKQLSITSETSSDEKNSIVTSECSETEKQDTLDTVIVKLEPKEEEEEEEEEGKSGGNQVEQKNVVTNALSLTRYPSRVTPHALEQEKAEETEIKEEVVTGDVSSTQTAVEEGPREEKSPLLCEESFEDIVSSSQQEVETSPGPSSTAVSRTPHNPTPTFFRVQLDTARERDTARAERDIARAERDAARAELARADLARGVAAAQETREKEEAAAILMSFPGNFTMKAGQGSGAYEAPAHSHLQFAYQYPSSSKPAYRLPLSPHKDMQYITTSGCVTQYMATGSVRPVITAAGIAKIPTASHVTTVPTASHVTTPATQQSNLAMGQQRVSASRSASKAGAVPIVVPDNLAQGHINTALKMEERKKGRKRKIQQADSTSDIGSRLQQFDFRPDPCEDCDKRPEDRPRRVERDKARRGTVKNSEGAKLVPGGTCERAGGSGTQTNPPYWIPGSVVGGSYVRSGNAVPLYYPAGSDVIQGGYYIPMRPPGMGPYPPGYSPKFPLPTAKPGTAGPENRECKPEEETARVSESTLAEPDSTVSDEKPLVISRGSREETPPYNTPPYRTPPHIGSSGRSKSTPNMDSDSSDEKTTIPGMSPLVLTHSMSESSDREGSSSVKVNVFDKDFGIHMFEGLDIHQRIKYMQGAMSEMQKCYSFFKGQISAIDKKERERRKSKKRRKSKQRTSSLSKSDKAMTPSRDIESKD